MCLYAQPYLSICTTNQATGLNGTVCRQVHCWLGLVAASVCTAKKNSKDTIAYCVPLLAELL